MTETTTTDDEVCPNCGSSNLQFGREVSCPDCGWTESDEYDD